MDLVDEFNNYRSKMNERLLSYDNIVIKRFFSLEPNISEWSSGCKN